MLEQHRLLLVGRHLPRLLVRTVALELVQEDNVVRLHEPLKQQAELRLVANQVVEYRLKRLVESKNVFERLVVVRTRHELALQLLWKVSVQLVEIDHLVLDSPLPLEPVVNRVDDALGTLELLHFELLQVADVFLSKLLQISPLHKWVLQLAAELDVGRSERLSHFFGQSTRSCSERQGEAVAKTSAFPSRKPKSVYSGSRNQTRGESI